MDYNNLGDKLVKMEQADEKREDDVAAGIKTPSSGKSDIPSPESYKPTSRIVTTGLRKVVCKGIDTMATRFAKWKMDGYTERVDKDPILCDAFHVVAEKRAPAIITQAPETVVVVGLVGHAYAVNESNKKKEAGESSYTQYSASPEDGINVVDISTDTHVPAPPGPIYAAEDLYPIDLSIHGEAITQPTVINPSEFGFRDRDGQMVNAPASVIVPLTGKKRQRPVNLAPQGKRRRGQPPAKRQLPPSPLGRTHADIETDDDDDDDNNIYE